MVQAPPYPLSRRRMLDCTELLASFTIGRDRVTELLPPGFRFGNTAATALRADRETSAEILVSVMNAGEAHDENGVALGSTMVLGTLVAEPPHDLRLRGADLHGMCLFSFVDETISIGSEPVESGDQRITISVERDEIAINMTCYLSGLAAVHVPPRRSRLFQTVGEAEGIHDLACTGAVGSPTGLACVEIDGTPTLPAAMEGTAVRSSGFDARIEPLLAPPYHRGEPHRSWARSESGVAPAGLT